MKTLTKAMQDAITPSIALDLLQKGGDEFEKHMGRKMTYGEMREMYG